MWNNTSYLRGLNETNFTVPSDHPRALNWGVLSLSLLIIATAIGNILVCLAVCWERRLQNMTNYFLMSLAIADLLVSLLVMPLGMIVELYGTFPMDPSFCVIWAAMDVLMCTASIWHMCTMSMDRYFTLKYPMKYGRNKTRTMVALKITFVWVVSISICSPVSILGFMDYSNVFNDGICVPTIRTFIIYGSIFAFYVPLTIMVVTYILTIRILCNNQKMMQSISRKDLRTQRGHMKAPVLYRPHRLSPLPVHLMDHISGENETSVCTSVQESIFSTPRTPQSPCSDTVIPIVKEIKDNESDTRGSIKSDNQISHDQISLDPDSLTMQPSLTVPNLTTILPNSPSVCSSTWSPNTSFNNLALPQGDSMVSFGNFEFTMSAASSLNSMLSKAHHEGSVFGEDFDDPDIIEKLSQIEQEMDQCLQESTSTCSDSGVCSSVRQEDHDGGENECVPLNEEQRGEASDDVDTNETHAQDVEINESDQPPEDQIQPQTESTKESFNNIPAPDVPPKGMLTPNTQSEDSLDTSSENSDLITIHLKANGCFMYKVDYEKSGLSPPRDELASSRSGSPCLLRPSEADSDRDNEEYASSVSTIGHRKYSPRLPTKANPGTHACATKWKTLLRRQGRGVPSQKLNGTVKQIIPKRTASNEKKASKVLGIIFAVFVVLWTPFFVVNVITVACEPCLKAVTPSMMATIVWLGYLASLANPIIYTMFNTSFRRAFYKILTCKLPLQQKLPKIPESMYLTNASNWPSGDRRNTMTFTIKEY